LGGGGEDSDKKINEEIMKAPIISPDALFKKINVKDNGLFIFDLRGESDFSREHIAASSNFSLESLNEKAIGSAGAGKTSDIVIVNQRENVFEAAKKVNELAVNGFPNSKYLQGGINAWKNRGYPLISSGGGNVDGSKLKKIEAERLVGGAGVGSGTIQFLDVRGKDSFSQGHIPGAINIPFSDLEKKQGEISPVKKVVVYGNDENEAGRAAITLFDLNFFNAFVLEGGLEGWKKTGGKTEGSN
jgi:rhodanese-related sulfurtransferase